MLNATEEALIVVFRKHTRLPLEVCLAHLKPTIPTLSRSALHRCLRRYGVSRIPRGRAEKPPKFDLGAQSAHFTIEVCAMPADVGGRLFVAINQTRFVFAKVMKGVSADDAADFLDELRKNAPVRIWSIETSDHEAFTHPKGRPWDPKFPDRIHPFRKACRASMISHFVRKSKIQMMALKGWMDVERRLSLPL